MQELSETIGLLGSPLMEEYSLISKKKNKRRSTVLRSSEDSTAGFLWTRLQITQPLSSFQPGEYLQTAEDAMRATALLVNNNTFFACLLHHINIDECTSIFVFLHDLIMWGSIGTKNSNARIFMPI